MIVITGRLVMLTHAVVGVAYAELRIVYFGGALPPKVPNEWDTSIYRLCPATGGGARTEWGESALLLNGRTALEMGPDLGL